MFPNNIHPIAQMSRASIQKRDLSALIRIVQPMKLRTVLEIGTWRGYSAEVWDETFKPELLITLEKNKSTAETYIIDKPNYHYLFETDSQKPETFQKVANILSTQNSLIDFLFIDGAHTYSDVRTDFDLYSPLVREGGVIALHDILYIQKECQVNPLWEMLKRKYYYVEVNIGEDSTGLGFIYYEKGKRSIANESREL